MMRLIWLFLAIPALLTPFEKLDERYLIPYGDPDAPLQVVEYFSFSCPYCSSLFREEFAVLKDRYIDTGQVYWVFHPVPVDVLTLSAMTCLEAISSRHKRIFLEEMLPEALEEQPRRVAQLMERVMDLFGVVVPDLTDLDTMEGSSAFEAAFLFLKGGGLDVEALPSLEVAGELVVGALPTSDFVSLLCEERCREGGLR